MNDIFSENLKKATERTCNSPWSGGKNGKYFRCHFCGYKLKPGDMYRIIFTNDIPKAGGNPIVCEKCNDTTKNLRKKWVKANEEARTRFWWTNKNRD